LKSNPVPRHRRSVPKTGEGVDPDAQLIYPNLEHLPPGSTANFWDYNPEGSGWYVYGKCTVSADGLSVVPDPGVGFYEFTGAMEVNFPQRTDTNGAGDSSSLSASISARAARNTPVASSSSHRSFN
jgi:hypothetical protein